MKKGFIITLLVSAVILTGCGAKNDGVKEEEKKEYFDFTASEMVDRLGAEWLIDFTPIAVVDNEEKTEKIANYTAEVTFFDLDGDDAVPTLEYMFTCDDTTDKVSYILLFTDRGTAEAAGHFLYHISAIVQGIDPNANTEDIDTAIENGFNEYDFAIYEGEKYVLHASRSDEYFSVSFSPTENTKGD